MRLETERLEIVALTVGQLERWLSDLPQLEKELNGVYQAEPLTGFFREIVAGQWRAAGKEPGLYVWHTFWLILRKSDRTIIGSACFKDKPDAIGEVEIGYGLGKAFEKQGYMTEAVDALCRWAFCQTGVSRITAETDQDGYASQRILQRCGFQVFSRGETLWWRR